MRAIRTLLAAGLLLSACLPADAGIGAPQPLLPQVPLKVATPKGPVGFAVEVARSEDQHARGLMFRDHMAPDAGMLFVFARPAVQYFWMQNNSLF